MLCAGYRGTRFENTRVHVRDDGKILVGGSTNRHSDTQCSQTTGAGRVGGQRAVLEPTAERPRAEEQNFVGSYYRQTAERIVGRRRARGHSRCRVRGVCRAVAAVRPSSDSLPGQEDIVTSQGQTGNAVV